SQRLRIQDGGRFARAEGVLVREVLGKETGGRISLAKLREQFLSTLAVVAVGAGAHAGQKLRHGWIPQRRSARGNHFKNKCVHFRPSVTLLRILRTSPAVPARHTPSGPLPFLGQTGCKPAPRFRNFPDPAALPGAIRTAPPRGARR